MKKLLILLSFFVLTNIVKAQFAKPSGAVTIPTYSMLRTPADSGVHINQGLVNLYNSFLMKFDSVKVKGYATQFDLLKLKQISDSTGNTGYATRLLLQHKIDSLDLSGSANYIQAQIETPQSADYNISGAGYLGKNLKVGTTNSLTNQKIVFFGNSVTYGTNYTIPVAMSLNCTGINKGISGSTMHDFHTRYSEIPTITSGNIDEYKYIMFDYGINDSYAYTTADYASCLGTAIDTTINRGWPASRIVIITPNFTTLPGLIAFADTAIVVAKAKGVQWTNTYYYTRDNGGVSLLMDAVHPSVEGGAIMAKSILSSLDGGAEFSGSVNIKNAIHHDGTLFQGTYARTPLNLLDNLTHEVTKVGYRLSHANTTNTGMAGIDLSNSIESVGAYSPSILFSSRSNNDTYNSTYAYIHGVYQGVDGANVSFGTGDIIFGTSQSTGAVDRVRISKVGNLDVLTGTIWVGGANGFGLGAVTSANRLEYLTDSTFIGYTGLGAIANWSANQYKSTIATGVGAPFIVASTTLVPNLNSGLWNSYQNGFTSGNQTSDLTGLAGIHTNGSIYTFTPAHVKTHLSLNNVDNTADVNKSVASAVNSIQSVNTTMWDSIPSGLKNAVQSSGMTSIFGQHTNGYAYRFNASALSTFLGVTGKVNVADSLGNATGNYITRKVLTDGLSAKQNTLTNPVTSPNNGISGYLPHYTAAGTIDTTNISWNGKSMAILGPWTTGTNGGEQLIVGNSLTYQGRIGYNEDGYTHFSFDNSYNDPHSVIDFRFANTPVFSLYQTGNATLTGALTATNFILSSDRRLKTNIRNIGTKGVNIEYKQFELKSEKRQIRYGVIAQDLQKTNPELVRTDENGMLSVAYIDLLIKEIASLKERVSELEKQDKKNRKHINASKQMIIE